MVQVKVSQEMGRGVYASETIKAGQNVMLCEILVLDQIDTFKVNSTSLKYYTFKFNETQDCLVLGLGEIFNHDNRPNVSYGLVEHDGRMMMTFTALSDIDVRAQLFIDYAADTQVVVNEYIETGSLVG